jgi:hypothetical protein
MSVVYCKKMIPAEVVDYIFGFLHSDRAYATLEKCSVVFPHIVHRRLYSQIAFYILFGNLTGYSYSLEECIRCEPAYIVDPTKFFLVLNDHPYVANYVRAVNIIFMRMGSGPPYLDTFPLVPLVASILSNLSRIESIAVIAPCTCSWPALHPRFRTAFRNCLQLPSIKAVNIGSSVEGFPLSILEDCMNLRGLQLYGWFADGEGVSTSRYPRLRSLCVDTQPDFTRIISWMKSDTLHTLSLRVMGESPHFYKIRPLIKACSHTLVVLELDVGFGGL